MNDELKAAIAARRKRIAEAEGAPPTPAGPAETGEAGGEGPPAPEDQPPVVVDHLVGRCGSRHGSILVCARPAGHEGECGSANWPDGRADGVRWSGAEFRGFGPDATFMPPERPADADDHVAIPPEVDFAAARVAALREQIPEPCPKCGQPVIYSYRGTTPVPREPGTGKMHPCIPKESR